MHSAEKQKKAQSGRASVKQMCF